MNDLSNRAKNFKRGSELGFRAQSLVGSNAVNLSFSLAALRNQFLDVEKKNSVSKLLNAMNIFEFNSSAELYYRFVADSFLFKTPSLISLTVRTGSVLQVKFTGDLFNVIFFGNAGFAGETADFSGTQFLSYNYNQLRLGIQKKFQVHGNNTWEAGIGLSMITAKKGTGVKMDKGTLFTEQYGSFIDAGYQFQYFISDSSNSGKLQMDGEGLCVDAVIAWTSSNKKNHFSFYTNNVGFIGWNKETTIYSTDSTLHFEGIEVTNFLHSNDSSFLQFNIDTVLDKTGTDVKKENYRTLFPAGFAFRWSRLLPNKWGVSAGISYRPFPDLLPEVFLQPGYFFSAHFNGSFLFSYGGTNRFQTGIQLNGNIRDDIFFSLGSQNVLGLFLPEQTTSTSLFLQASVMF